MHCQVSAGDVFSPPVVESRLEACLLDLELIELNTVFGMYRM